MDARRNRSSLGMRRAALAGVGGLIAVAAFAGCSSETASDDEESSEVDVCAAVDEARVSLAALADTDVVQEGTTTLKERFAAFQDDLETVVESGQAELEEETAAVEDAVATLQETLSGITQDPTAADLTLIQPSLSEVATSVQELITAIESTC